MCVRSSVAAISAAISAGISAAIVYFRIRGNKLGHVCYSTMAAEMAAEMAATLLPMHIYCYICHQKVNKHYVYMYTNVVQHYNCQPQDNFLTLNITLGLFEFVQ